ncbi:MAG: DUF998 domain-containing protein [Ginsengibacter sp.]
MEAQNSQSPDEGYVISYQTLRKAVGIVGIALPVVLISAFVLLNPNCYLPPSLSHYYYTNLGTWFTGTLCVVAFFMFAYNGPHKIDKYASLIACICALGVAFCPANTYSDAGKNCIRVILNVSDTRNALHYGFAGLLFLTLAFFSLFLFTKTSGEVTNEKRVRNVIYKVCGWVILLSIAGIAVLTFMGKNPDVADSQPNIATYVLETIALVAFGFSWLVKGETFFAERKPHS